MTEETKPVRTKGGILRQALRQAEERKDAKAVIAALLESVSDKEKKQLSSVALPLTESILKLKGGFEISRKIDKIEAMAAAAAIVGASADRAVACGENQFDIILNTNDKAMFAFLSYHKIKGGEYGRNKAAFLKELEGKKSSEKEMRHLPQKELGI